MSQPYLIVRNGEAVDSASTYESAIDTAKREANDYPMDTTYIYQNLATVKLETRVSVTAPLVQVKR